MQYLISYNLSYHKKRKKNYDQTNYNFSLFLTIQSVNADECTYKTETISENGVIVSTKQIKVCNETVYMSNGFWHDLMYSEQGNEMFWNAMIFIFQ